ncbi:MAG: addiction module protein [Sporichthyaceae bacterium]
MTSEAHDLFRTALALPADDRAELAAVLLDSLDDEGADGEHEFSEAWLAEIEVRARRVIDGESEGTPWEEVRERVREQLARRRSR